jgi:hypothetical protein
MLTNFASSMNKLVYLEFNKPLTEDYVLPNSVMALHLQRLEDSGRSSRSLTLTSPVITIYIGKQFHGNFLKFDPVKVSVKIKLRALFVR